MAELFVHKQVMLSTSTGRLARRRMKSLDQALRHGGSTWILVQNG